MISSNKYMDQMNHLEMLQNANSWETKGSNLGDVSGLMPDTTNDEDYFNPTSV